MKNIKIYADILEATALKQFNDAMDLECNVQGALMPDAHTGYTLPIGAVIKSKGVIFPSYVGYDIGCGMGALKLDLKKEDVDLLKLKYDIIENIPVGLNCHKDSKTNLNLFTENKFFTQRHAKQMGTLGSGNHFVEVGEGRDGLLWVVVHSGSRGFGHTIATYYMKLAASLNIDVEIFLNEFDDKNIKWLEHVNKSNDNHKLYKYISARNKYIENQSIKSLKTLEGHYGFNLYGTYGEEYISNMNIAIHYAYMNRFNMVKTVVELLGCDFNSDQMINRTHNHAEIKDGYVIHRKGATHANNGMMGVIPANMKDGSFIVRGKGDENSMCSSSHGAGRVMSRTQARKLLSLSEFNQTMQGVMTNHTSDTLDESPLAYKDIYQVMELQKDLVEVVDHVKPLINIKG